MFSQSQKYRYLLLFSVSALCIRLKATQLQHSDLNGSVHDTYPVIQGHLISPWEEVPNEGKSLFDHLKEGNVGEVKRLLEDDKFKFDFSLSLPYKIYNTNYSRYRKLQGYKIIHMVPYKFKNLPYKINKKMLELFLGHDRSLLKQTIDEKNEDKKGFSLLHLLTYEDKKEMNMVEGLEAEEAMKDIAPEEMIEMALAYEKTEKKAAQIARMVLKRWFAQKGSTAEVYEMIEKYAMPLEKERYSSQEVIGKNRRHKSQHPIHIAAMKGHNKVLKTLLKHNPSYAYSLEKVLRFNPFFFALKGGHIETVRALLIGNKKLINTKIGDSLIRQYAGMNAFHMVSYEDYSTSFKGYEELLELLFSYDENDMALEKIEDYNWDYSKWNALHVAIFTKKDKVVAILLRKARSLARELIPKGRWSGYTPLQVAIIKGSMTMLGEFLLYEEEEILLRAALQRDNNMKGYTAIHMATEEQNEMIIRHLLKRYPSLAKEVIQGRVFKRGFNAIQLATFTAHINEKIAKIFLEKVPSCIGQVIIGNNYYNGLNTLHIAMIKGNAMMKLILLESNYKHKEAVIKEVILNNEKGWNGFNAFLMNVKLGGHMVKEFLQYDPSLIETVVKDSTSDYYQWDALKIATSQPQLNCKDTIRLLEKAYKASKNIS